MDLIDKIGEIVGLSREEVINNSHKIDEKLTYYCNPVRGGVQVVSDSDGNYLAATSSVGPDELIKEYKKGERVHNIFENE
ncbi:hypothetical protein IJS18_02175 [Candidatus Saccharibacteria bacterium]|nr:hypothetical protein [Candidatus Saccharibacteria bacterium]